MRFIVVMHMDFDRIPSKDHRRESSEECGYSSSFVLMMRWSALCCDELIHDGCWMLWMVFLLHHHSTQMPALRLDLQWFFVMLFSWNQSFIMSAILIFMNEYCSAGSCFFAAHPHYIDKLPPGHTYKDPGIGRNRAQSHHHLVQFIFPVNSCLPCILFPPTPISTTHSSGYSA